jgi:hypothetical protein
MTPNVVDETIDDVEILTLLELASRKRRVLRQRAYRRLAATILRVDVASLAFDLTARGAISAADAEIHLGNTQVQPAA